MRAYLLQKILNSTTSAWVPRAREKALVVPRRNIRKPDTPLASGLTEHPSKPANSRYRDDADVMHPHLPSFTHPIIREA